MAKAVVKKSKVATFFKIVFLSIVLIIIALFSFLYFGKNVNSLTIYFDVSSIDSNYSISEENDDYSFESLNEKISSTADKKLFSGDEISSYINRNENFDDFDFLSLKCEDDYIIISVKYKTDNLSQLNFIDKKLPNEIYLEIKSEISCNEKYIIKNEYTKISNLSLKKSKNVLSYYNLFKKQINPNEITNQVLDMIISDIYVGDIKGYSYEKLLDESYFSVYYTSSDSKGYITYSNTKGVVNENPSEFDVTDETFELKPLVYEGYNFLGWFDEDNSQIEFINTASIRDYNLEARWSIIEYQITYVLNGGIISSLAPTSYTVEDPDIDIPTPTREYAEFVGWDDGSGEYVIDYVINHGSTGDIVLTAMFEGEVNTITLYGNGDIIDTFEIDKGIVLTKEYIDTYIDLTDFGGYSISEWYTDLEMSELYTYDKSIKMDYSLYCDLEYVYESNIYKYIDNIGNALTSKTFTATSKEMLKALVEYIYITQLTEKIYVSTPYASSARNEIVSVNEEVYDAINWNWTASYGGDSSKAYLFFTGKADLVTNTMDPLKEEVYTQEDYALYQYVGTRTNDFDDFNRLKVNKKIPVSNTTSLVYALELGYNPECSGRALEIINMAKDVLREIIDDNMTDYEKLKQIYVWTMINTSYDYKAVDSTLDTNTKLTYKSWYAEGVFEDGVVVCEGYTKAVTILSCLENIPCVVVTGDGHAWNKVYVDGLWYVLDATHGDQPAVINNIEYEIVTFDQFLITDAKKAALGYSSTKFSQFVCNTTFNYFETFKISYNGATTDLLIDSSSDAEVLLNYIKNNNMIVPGSKYRTLELRFGGDYNYTKLKTKALTKGISFENITMTPDFEAFDDARMFFIKGV